MHGYRKYSFTHSPQGLRLRVGCGHQSRQLGSHRSLMSDRRPSSGDGRSVIGRAPGRIGCRVGRGVCGLPDGSGITNMPWSSVRYQRRLHDWSQKLCNGCTLTPRADQCGRSCSVRSSGGSGRRCRASLLTIITVHLASQRSSLASWPGLRSFPGVGRLRCHHVQLATFLM